jgi:hypothetical protein
MDTDNYLPTWESLERLQRLFQRFKAGDATALPAYETALEANPLFAKHCGDLAARSEAAWLELICSTDLSRRQTVERELRQLKQELSGPSPSALERLLVDKAAASWLQTCHADALFAEVADGRHPQHAAGLRRQAATREMYLESLRALASIQEVLRQSRALRPEPDAEASFEGIDEQGVRLAAEDGCGSD